MREGNIDVSAIEEGARRLRNKLQEDGYFFTESYLRLHGYAAGSRRWIKRHRGNLRKSESGSVERPHRRDYAIRLKEGRRFRLTDIRITGTNRLSFEDVEADLKSQKASALGLIPFLGYGRGYTSLTLLEQDRRTVRNYMRDLGYRRAEV